MLWSTQLDDITGLKMAELQSTVTNILVEYQEAEIQIC